VSNITGGDSILAVTGTPGIGGTGTGIWIMDGTSLAVVDNVISFIRYPFSRPIFGLDLNLDHILYSICVIKFIIYLLAT